MTARGGLTVYGNFLTAVGDAVGPDLDEGFGMRHGGVFEGRRYGCVGKRYWFVMNTQRSMFEASGM